MYGTSVESRVRRLYWLSKGVNTLESKCVLIMESKSTSVLQQVCCYAC